MQRRTFIASLAVFAIPEIVHAECPDLDYVARYVTREGATIPADGGVLLALTTTDRRMPTGDPFAGEYTLVAGERRTRLHTTSIGPGLCRLDVPRNATSVFTMEGPIGALHVSRGEVSPAIEQPAIRGVFVPEGSARDQTMPSVTLVRPVPVGAVAAVLRRYVGRTATPTLVGRVRAGTLGITLNELGRCAPPMPGSLVPSIGARVDLVYVDAFGRVSAPSGAVVFGG